MLYTGEYRALRQPIKSRDPERHTINLPIELLLLIFDYYISNSRRPETLLRVCKGWAAVAADPRFWTNIDITFPSPHLHIRLREPRILLQRTRAYLARSSNRPLHLTCTVQADATAEELDITLVAVNMAIGDNGCHMQRWETAKFLLMHKGMASFFATPELKYRTPPLVALSIESVQYNSFDLSRIFPYCPRLRHVQTCFFNNIRLSNNIYRNTELLTIMDGCTSLILHQLPLFTNLQILDLDTYEGLYDSGHYPNEPITIPRVSKLVIRDTAVALLLEHIIFPALSHLVLVGSNTRRAHGSLLRVLEGHVSGIKTLELDAFKAGMPHLASIFWRDAESSSSAYRGVQQEAIRSAFEMLGRLTGRTDGRLRQPNHFSCRERRCRYGPRVSGLTEEEDQGLTKLREEYVSPDASTRLFPSSQSSC